VDDAELVLAVRRGDAAAFSMLYRAHVRAVHHVVRQYTGDEDVFDVVQDVFLRALQRLGTLRDPDRFRPWLLSIARYAAIDNRRARSRVDALDADAIDQLAATDRGPSELAELAELSELVRGCIAGLSQRDATAVVLVAQFGYSIDEVAQVFGVSHGAAKVLLHRARRRLRNALALTVLVHRQAAGCAELQAMGPDDLLAAGRHIEDCKVCMCAAGKEVELYGVPSGSRSASGSGPKPVTIRPRLRSAALSDSGSAAGDHSVMAKPVTSASSA